ALLVRRARDRPADANAVDPALVLAQHLAQPDRQHLAEDEHVAVLVAGPGLVAVEHQLDPRLGLLTQVPRALDHPARAADAEVLLLLLAALARQDRKSVV